MSEKKKTKLGIQLFQTKAIEYNPNKFETVKNREFPKVKPTGGLWTSTYTEKECIPSGWLEWCKIEQFISEKKINGILLKPKKECKITEIDTLNDLKMILKKYPTKPNIIDEIHIDFEKLANDFDGLHLTDEGQWNTRLTRPNLYGWDSESTIWFNPDCLEQIGKIDLSKFYKTIEEK